MRHEKKIKVVENAQKKGNDGDRKGVNLEERGGMDRFSCSTALKCGPKKRILLSPKRMRDGKKKVWYESPVTVFKS